MADIKLCLKDYINCIGDTKSSKKAKPSNKKARYSGAVGGGAVSTTTGGDGGGGMGESYQPLITELLGGSIPGSFSSNQLAAVQVMKHGEEEQETSRKTNKIDQARGLVKALVNQPDSSRAEIINQLVSRLGVTDSTAVSYYERIAKELGITKDSKKSSDSGMTAGSSTDMSSSGSAEQQPQDQAVEELPADTELELDDDIPESDDPDRQGVIRVVKKSHLVYKRQNTEGTYDELWVYNIDGDISNELDIRRDILAGTDIPTNKTQSDDGSQKYTLATLGNAQILSIQSLPP
jgi:hypothetical protein